MYSRYTICTPSCHMVPTGGPSRSFQKLPKTSKSFEKLWKAFHFIPNVSMHLPNSHMVKPRLHMGCLFLSILNTLSTRCQQRGTKSLLFDKNTIYTPHHMDPHGSFYDVLCLYLLNFLWNFMKFYEMFTQL